MKSYSKLLFIKSILSPSCGPFLTAILLVFCSFGTSVSFAQLVDDFDGNGDAVFAGNWFAWGDSELGQEATGLVSSGRNLSTSRRLIHQQGQWWGVVAQKVFNSVADISEYETLSFWWRSDNDDSVSSLDLNLVFQSTSGTDVIYSLKQSLEPQLNMGFNRWVQFEVPLAASQFDNEMPGAFDLTRLQKIEILIRSNTTPANEMRTIYFDDITFKKSVMAKVDEALPSAEPIDWRHYDVADFEHDYTANTEADKQPIEPTLLANYQVWANRFPEADLSDPNADFDLDGCSNEKERIFGTDPTSSASCEPIVLSLDNASGSFSYTRQDDAINGLDYSIWFSKSQQPDSWAEDKGAIQVAAQTDAHGVEQVRVTLSPDILMESGVFVQVRVDLEE